MSSQYYVMSNVSIIIILIVLKMKYAIFIDETNLWSTIADRQTQERLPRDAETDIMKLLATEDRKIDQCYLYGSRPTEYDRVWKAVMEKNLINNIHYRSNGHEEEIDMTMTADMVELASDIYHTGKAGEVIFIIVVTGDRDLKSAIEKIKGKGIHVETQPLEHNKPHVFHDETKNGSISPRTQRLGLPEDEGYSSPKMGMGSAQGNSSLKYSPLKPGILPTRGLGILSFQ